MTCIFWLTHLNIRYNIVFMLLMPIKDNLHYYLEAFQMQYPPVQKTFFVERRFKIVAPKRISHF
jgi:hypothetical protein